MVVDSSCLSSQGASFGDTSLEDLLVLVRTVVVCSHSEGIITASRYYEACFSEDLNLLRQDSILSRLCGGASGHCFETTVLCFPIEIMSMQCG